MQLRNPLYRLLIIFTSFPLISLSEKRAFNELQSSGASQRIYGTLKPLDIERFGVCKYKTYDIFAKIYSF